MSEKLEEILSGVPDYVEVRWAASEYEPEKGEGGEPSAGAPVRLKSASIGIAFGERGFGFGEIAIKQDADGQVFLDTESMGKEAAAHFLMKLLASAIDDKDQDHERHKKFNAAFKRTCGPACKVCGS